MAKFNLLKHLASTHAVYVTTRNSTYAFVPTTYNRIFWYSYNSGLPINQGRIVYISDFYVGKSLTFLFKGSDNKLYQITTSPVKRYWRKKLPIKNVK